VLYPNWLYLVRITVRYGVQDALGNYIDTTSKIFYRWLWTNSMFNEYYYTVSDFNNL